MNQSYSGNYSSSGTSSVIPSLFAFPLCQLFKKLRISSLVKSCGFFCKTNLLLIFPYINTTGIVYGVVFI